MQEVVVSGHIPPLQQPQPMLGRLSRHLRHIPVAPLRVTLPQGGIKLGVALRGEAAIDLIRAVCDKEAALRQGPTSASEDAGGDPPRSDVEHVRHNDELEATLPLTYAWRPLLPCARAIQGHGRANVAELLATMHVDDLQFLRATAVPNLTHVCAHAHGRHIRVHGRRHVLRGLPIECRQRSCVALDVGPCAAGDLERLT
mmetsp:Transcript_63454/g.136477  ORF Transcript_63454/g.136477 Transcript_63454/m.136477 type:complete len:200 (-) Transcript_63454:93-692(-)